ncbi:MAG: hypothetical protein BGP06_13525 [Rhizobiales bacterium 65-9]|nr:MAG: hypothetical protein BGP06_13525 [Rhizobiales bacterium 65-9]
MLMLLSLTPFAAFTLLGRLVSLEVGVWAATLMALGLVLSDWLRPGGTIKMIEAGSLALFGALALYSLNADMAASRSAVRAVSNGGLLAISLVSLAIGKPFSLQYARETASPAALASQAFLKQNYVITSVWAGAFAVTTGISALSLLANALPRWLESLVIYGALAFGALFTMWYSGRVRRLNAERLQ